MICQHYKKVAIAIYSFSQPVVNNWNSFDLPTDYEVVHAPDVESYKSNLNFLLKSISLDFTI